MSLCPTTWKTNPSRQRAREANFNPIPTVLRGGGGGGRERSPPSIFLGLLTTSTRWVFSLDEKRANHRNWKDIVRLSSGGCPSFLSRPSLHIHTRSLVGMVSLTATEPRQRPPPPLPTPTPCIIPRRAVHTGYFYLGQPYGLCRAVELRYFLIAKIRNFFFFV